MKKILIIFSLIIIYVIIITEKVEPTFVEKIDLNLEKNEMGITFIPLEESRSLLINKDDFQILIILEYLKDDEIEDVLDMFGAKKLDYVLMNSYYDIDLESKNRKVITNKNIEIEQMAFKSTKNILEVDYLDHNFCVYKNFDSSNINRECEYIYYLNISENIDINDRVNMIFYDEDTNPDYLERVFDKWIDMYMIKKNYYVTLKLDEDTYDTITIPIDNK